MLSGQTVGALVAVVLAIAFAAVYLIA